MKIIEQFSLAEKLKYYEKAYTDVVRLIKASPSGSEAQILLFQSAKYYQQKANSLRKELEST